MNRSRQIRLGWCTLGAMTVAGCTCGSNDPQGSAALGNADAAEPSVPDASERIDCQSDTDCASGFCDVGTCAIPTPLEQVSGTDVRYGRPCSGILLIGPYGTLFGRLTECGNYMCAEGRCRSCVSSQQCYELWGVRSCSGNEIRPGKQCRDTSADGSPLYVPVEPEPRAGQPLDAVAQPAGAPARAIFTLGPGLAASNARLAVMWWHQRSGDFDEYRQIALDMPLEPATTEIEIAFEDLALPYAENLICFRRCTDRAVCDCAGLPQVALASVIVSLDRDDNGALSLAELREEQIGGAVALIGWAPVGQQSVPIGFDATFDRIPAGFAVYIRGEFVQLDPDMALDAAYPLSFCPPGDASCTFPLTRVFCHRECDRDWGLNRFGI